MKVAVVGCGNISEVHIPFILNQPHAQMIGVCDLKKESARFIAEKYHIKAHYSDFDEMLEKGRPDIVHVLTSVQSHAPLMIKALKSGSHVLVEKAMCVNKEESDEIIRTAREHDRKVCVDHTLLFDPIFMRAGEILRKGALGELVRIEALICDDHPDKKRQGLARPWVDGVPGGILNELLPHPLYLALNFLPEMGVKSAHIQRTSTGDIAGFHALFAAGKGEASIRISLTERPIQQWVNFYCTNGILCADYRNLTLTVKRSTGLPGPIHRLYSNLSQAGQILGETLRTGWGVVRGRVKAYAGLENLIKQFYEAVRLDRPSPVSEHDGAKLVSVMNDVWDYLNVRYDMTDQNSLPDRASSGKFAAASSGKQERPDILVTGATGFVGSHLARRLVKEGKAVRVICRKGSDLSKLPNNHIEIVYGDMRDADSLKQAITGMKLIYHCAAATRGKWIDHFESTIEGTRNLCEIAGEKGVDRIVYISSTGIFNTAGFPDGVVLREHSDLEENPEKRGFYTKAKLEAEKIVREYMKGGKPDISILRPGIVYGDGGRGFVADAGRPIGRKLILVPGLWNRPLHLVYVENLVDAILLAGQSEKSGGRIYNIVDPDQPTVREYLGKYREVTGTRPVAVYVPRTFLANGFLVLGKLSKKLMKMELPDMNYRIRSLNHNFYDVSKARSELGWHSKVGLDEALRRTFPRPN